jgi:hypothetical protein
MALDEDSETHESVTELVGYAVSCRAKLERGGDAATRLARALAYDVALVRLCEELEVAHEMLGPHAGTLAREETERRLADRLPLLATALGGPLSCA